MWGCVIKEVNDGILLHVRDYIIVNEYIAPVGLGLDTVQ